MKKLLFLSALLIFACSMSTEELEQEVLESIKQELAENSMFEDAEIVDFGLVHKGGNEYKGILELIIKNPVAELLPDWSEQVNKNPLFQELLNENIQVTRTVEVVYDGETFTCTWNLDPTTSA